MNNNSWQYMDKQQIMDLSKTQQANNNNNNNNSNNSDFISLMNNNPNDDDVEHKKEEDEIIVPSYDFQPIRSAMPRQHSSLDGPPPPPRVWNSADSISISPLRNYSSLDSIEPAKGVPEKDHNAGNAALVSEIERTMKLFADNLMHALEGVSARISQLESRSRNLENSVDDLKITMGNNQGSTDGKMRQLENILREVQSGVQVIRDKQDIIEGQLHLAKLQTTKVENQPEPQNQVQSSSYQPIASAPLQSHHHPQSPPSLSLSSLSPPNAPPPAPQQSLPNPYPPPQRDPYYPPPSHQQETTAAQQYPPPLPHYSQPPTPPHHHLSLSSTNPTQPQFLPPHHPEDSPFPPHHQTYPPNLQHQPIHHPSNPSSQQFYPSPSNMYDSPSIKLGSGYSPNEPSPYPYGGPSGMKQQQPQLPTARVLPQALPAASGTGSNRVPIDDVVDKVSNMGFSREQARATVRKLMENGQAVDLNIVLDKLMNEGAEGQPPRGWYGR